MAILKELQYSLETSVRIGEYRFAKPRLGMQVQIEEGDNIEVVFAELKTQIHKELKKLMKEVQNEF